MRRVAFATLGCKLNQYDSELMLERLKNAGWRVVAFAEEADAYVINTCTVTGTADQKSRNMIARARRSSPSAVVVVAGCLAQRDAEKLVEREGVRLVIGTARRAEIASLLERAMGSDEPVIAVGSLTDAAFEDEGVSARESRTRAIVKIQEGCDRHCAYCIIPSVRGRSRSRPISSVADEVDGLARAGYPEITLTGIHLSSYGRDLPGTPSLADAVSVACAPQGIARVRLGSLEPTVVDDAFIALIGAQVKLCRHFHLSLQSGSDGVLRRMARTYTAERFYSAVARLRGAFPEVSLTTDVIVGFPGETEEEHEESLGFVRACAFEKIHVFPFSPREGSKAAIMPDQVPDDVKKRRAAQMRALGGEMERAALRRRIGIRARVVVEELEAGLSVGYTDTYERVTMRGARPGDVVSALILGANDDQLLGVLSMDGCVFCKIASGEITSNKVYEDDDCVCFHDIAPVAPAHVVLIPKRHIASLQECSTEDAVLLGTVLAKVPQIAEVLGIAQSGYRVITNSGPDGQQSIAHLHFHIMGGRKLKWEN